MNPDLMDTFAPTETMEDSFPGPLGPFPQNQAQDEDKDDVPSLTPTEDDDVSPVEAGCMKLNELTKGDRVLLSGLQVE